MFSITSKSGYFSNPGFNLTCLIAVGSIALIVSRALSQPPKTIEIAPIKQKEVENPEKTDTPFQSTLQKTKTLGEALLELEPYPTCNQPVIEIEDYLTHFFSLKGQSFQKIQHCSDTFKCPLSTFSDIELLLKELPQDIRDSLHFFYDSTNKYICCTLNSKDSTPLQIPNAHNWPNCSINRKSPTTVAEIEEESLLHLSNGIVISQEQFLTHPLFKHTLEKYSVFEFLSSFSRTKDFSSKYLTFLSDSKQEDWTKRYETKPLELAYLSLYAYLSKNITQEEFFITQMVASAQFESSPEKPALFTVLNKTNAKDYLRGSHYPVDESGSLSALEKLDQKSVIERTAIAYTFSKESIEELIYKTNASGPIHLGFQDSEIAVILPPELSIALYEDLFRSNTTFSSKNTWMFGYHKSLKPLYIGRPISIASPLFKTPHVHEFSGGKQLGMTFHDMVGHLPAELFHPYVQEIIQLGDVLIKSSHEELKLLGRNLLDRAISNDTENQSINYLQFVVGALFFSFKNGIPLELKTELISVLKTHISKNLFDEKLFELFYDTPIVKGNPLFLAFLKELQETS